jgi:hypothetical protein
MKKLYFFIFYKCSGNCCHQDDKVVKFKKIKIEELKNLPNEEEKLITKNSYSRRSISIQNPIENENIYVGEQLNMTIDGSNVFSSDSPMSLKITNIFPSWPIWLNSTLKLTLKGSYNTDGIAKGIAISGNYAYIADKQNLQVINVIDSTNPILIGSCLTDRDARKVAISGNYAYVTDFDEKGCSSLQIIDITDPLNPSFVSSYKTSNPVLGVAVSGNYAYVTCVASDNSGFLQIIDITDHLNPIFVSSYKTPNPPYSVVVLGNYAYVAAGESGLRIVDITNSTNPTSVNSLSASGTSYEVAISGNYAYLVGLNNDGGGFLQVVNITNPREPIIIGSYNTPALANDVAISGNYAYVAAMESGLYVIDITDLTNPIFKGSYYTEPEKAWGVVVSSNYAYVANGKKGLQVIVFEPDKLVLSGTPSLVERYSIEIEACNEGKECISDIFDIIVRDNKQIADSGCLKTWLSIGTVVSCLMICLIILGLICICLEKIIKKINFKNLEKEVKERQGFLGANIDKAKEKKCNEEVDKLSNLKEDLEKGNNTNIVKKCAKLMRRLERKNFRKFINPASVAIKLAKAVKSEFFIGGGVEKSSKKEILTAFNRYIGFTLLKSSEEHRNILSEDLQGEVSKGIEQVKKESKDNYDILFEISCVEEALLMMKESDNAMELLKFVFKIQNIEEMGDLLEIVFKKSKKMPAFSMWYSKLIVLRYRSYLAKYDKKELDDLQELIPQKGDWQLIYGVAQILGRIALMGDIEEIRKQAYFGGKTTKIKKRCKKNITKKVKLKGLKDYLKYVKKNGKTIREKAIGEVVTKALYLLEKKSLQGNRELQVEKATKELKALQNKAKKDKKLAKRLNKLESWRKRKNLKKQTIKVSKKQLSSSVQKLPTSIQSSLQQPPISPQKKSSLSIQKLPTSIQSSSTKTLKQSPTSSQLQKVTSPSTQTKQQP